MGAGKKDMDKALKEKLAAEAEAAKEQNEEKEEEEEKKEDGVMRLLFHPPHYTVMECVGTFEVTIVREGGDLNLPCKWTTRPRMALHAPQMTTVKPPEHS